MSAEPLPIGQAAKLLDAQTRELVQLIYDRRVPFILHKGMAHVPADALDEYRLALDDHHS